MSAENDIQYHTYTKTNLSIFKSANIGRLCIEHLSHASALSFWEWRQKRKRPTNESQHLVAANSSKKVVGSAV